MAKNKIIVLAVLFICVFISGVFVGIAISKHGSDTKSEKTTVAISEAKVDKSGYTYEGKTYSKKIKIQGRSNNAAKESYYIVYTNSDSISFEEVDKRFWSSESHSDEAFVIIEFGVIE